MFCPVCGSQNEDGAPFCTQCGSPLAEGGQTSQQSDQQAQPQPQMQQQVPVQQPSAQQVSMQQPQQQPQMQQVPMQQPQMQYGVMPQKQSNGLGVGGFVCALLGMLLCWVPGAGWILWLVGLILSAIGVFRQPKGLAIAGLVISLVDLILLMALVGCVAGTSAGLLSALSH